MNLSHLIATYGDDKVQIQPLDDCTDTIKLSRGFTKITFGTEEPFGPEGTVRMGLVIWMDRARVAEIIAADKTANGEGGGGEGSAEVESRFSLEWIAGARPPVHPDPMRGRQSFSTFDLAIAFMLRQAPDARFVSLTEHIERQVDRTADARVALEAKGCEP